MATTQTGYQPTRQDGKDLRRSVPRSSHGEWSPASDRPDPVSLIAEQNHDRLPWLVPIRHWRMSQSPFAFYRGTATVMAHDLSMTADSGIRVQICGDAHLSNFGAFASPDRELVFDVNDFDETLPGPWEWDVKRLVASFVVAARHNGYDDTVGSQLASLASRAYRGAMRAQADKRYLDSWYTRIAVDDIVDAFSDEASKKDRKRQAKFVRKARSKDSLKALKKLAEEVEGDYRIVSQPPLLIPLREIPLELSPQDIQAELIEAYTAYLDSVPDHLEALIGQFRFKDFAVKVVGVGSVGTRCFVILLEGRDAGDPFFLQVKEATGSVLEKHLPPSRYTHHGQRVVEGQRLMQAASDSFLGWSRSIRGHDYYWRQLKDMKASPDIERANEEHLGRFARICGLALARAHSRSGSAPAIAGYLGKSEVFDEAMGKFAVAYADQTERDYSDFLSAIDAGRLEARP